MERVNRPVPAEESAYPKSMTGAVGLTLALVPFPGLILAAICSAYLGGYTAPGFLAILAMGMGAICVRLYNGLEIRGAGRSMIASVLPVVICIAAFALAPLLIILGAALSLVGGAVMYAWIAGEGHARTRALGTR